MTTISLDVGVTRSRYSLERTISVWRDVEIRHAKHVHCALKENFENYLYDRRRHPLLALGDQLSSPPP